MASVVVGAMSKLREVILDGNGFHAFEGLGLSCRAFFSWGRAL